MAETPIPLICILGPTATGKTRLAAHVAIETRFFQHRGPRVETYVGSEAVRLIGAGDSQYV